MRSLLVFLFAVASPAFAGEGEFRLIDATKLSVEELMAMAAEARQNAQLHDCCDWGGLGCVPETVRGGATMQMSQIVTMQSTNSSASKSEGD